MDCYIEQHTHIRKEQRTASFIHSFYYFRMVNLSWNFVFQLFFCVKIRFVCCVSRVCTLELFMKWNYFGKCLCLFVFSLICLCLSVSRRFGCVFFFENNTNESDYLVDRLCHFMTHFVITRHCMTPEHPNKAKLSCSAGSIHEHSSIYYSYSC